MFRWRKYDILLFYKGNGFRKNSSETIRPSGKINEDIYKKETDINQKLQKLQNIYTKDKDYFIKINHY